MTKYTLYVPVEAYTPAAKDIIEELTNVFGGCTRTKGFGSWINEHEVCIEEEVYVFTYLSTQPWHELQYRVQGIERRITDMTGESCLLSTNEQVNITFTLATS